MYRGTGVPHLKKTQPPVTLPQAYAKGPKGVLWRWAFSYGRGTPYAMISTHRPGRSLSSLQYFCFSHSAPLALTPLYHSRLAAPSLSHSLLFLLLPSLPLPSLTLPSHSHSPLALTPLSRPPSVLSHLDNCRLSMGSASRFPYGLSAEKPWPVLPPLEFRVQGAGLRVEG